MILRVMLFLSVLTVSSAFGATTFWEGTISNNWMLSDNWDNGVPGISDLTVINGDPCMPFSPQIMTGQTANAGHLLLGQGPVQMIVESGAIFNIGTSGAYTGYASGESTLIIKGALDCSSGAFGMGNSKWVDPCDSQNVQTGHSIVILDDPGATLNASEIVFGEIAYDTEVYNWNNFGGTGELIINDGTVTAAIGGIVDSPYCDGYGINISSAGNGQLSIPSTYNVWWFVAVGGLVADSGYGTIEETTVGDRIICTARAYDPNVDDRRPFNHDWDNGGDTQSVSNNWNYVSNTIPWPGDFFTTSGKAPLGSHPVFDVDTEVAVVTVGWKPGMSSIDDVIEVLDDGNLTIGSGIGTLSLGANSSDPDDRGKGTLIMNGGRLSCGPILNGAGDPNFGLYGEGIIHMNGGVLNCNYLQMALEDPFDSANPASIGSLILTGGTLNIINSQGLLNTDLSNGIHITGGEMIIEGDMTSEITTLFTSGKITSDSSLILDYDILNTGKTTLTTCAGLTTDISGDCEINMLDLAELASEWFATDCGNRADLNRDCVVDVLDLEKISNAWLIDLTFLN